MNKFYVKLLNLSYFCVNEVIIYVFEVKGYIYYVF